MPGGKKKHELQELETLRAENKRLKSELLEAKADGNCGCGSREIHGLKLKNKLQLTEVQLKGVLEMANIGTWSYDFNSDEFIPSAQIRAIWKLPETNISKEFLRHLHPEDRERIIQALKNPVEASAYDYKYRFIGDDGNMYYLLSRCVVECGEDKRPLRAHGITWDITERILHEKQTSQTESHIWSFFEKIGLGAWEYAVGSEESMMVHNIRRFLNIEGEGDMVNNTELLELVHFDDLARVKDDFEQVVSGKAPVFDCMFRVRRGCDDYAWILSRGMPVFDNLARVYKIIGCMEDISQSKRYNSLRERFLFMQNIADALPIPVYYKDLQGRLIGFNEAFREFVRINAGRTPLIGSTVRDLHSLRDRELGFELERDENAFIRNSTDNFEKTYTMHPAPGKKRVVVNKKSILYENGDPEKPRYLVGGIFDVTAMKETEERLQQATERLNATLNAMNEMIMCFDRDLNLQWANRAAKLALGGDSKRLAGRKWNNIWKEAGRENLDAPDNPVRKVLDEGLKMSTGKVKTSDGRIFDIRAYPLRSGRRKASGVLEMSMDVTELEAVKERAEIHKEQLRLADKMKSLGVLISGVAHEVNNPNNSIGINISLLERMWQELKPQVRRLAEEDPGFKVGNFPGSELEQSVNDLLFGIQDGSRRISRIIDSLKAYIRNVPVDREEVFDLHDAIENAVFLLKNQIGRATGKFSYKTAGRKLPVKGVQQKIEQVIINVLQNSCQALTSHSQKIKIETLAFPDAESGQALAVVKVADAGRGIDPEDIGFITDPFFTTRREAGGTGLGLSISSSILEEHKGFFKFESTPGRGTVTQIVLPLTELEESGSGRLKNRRRT